MIKKWVEKANKFKREAHSILCIPETSKHRIITLEKTYKKLTSLSIEQDDLFRQSLTCFEKECFRAAHVMAWSAFMDFVEHKLCEDGCKKIKKNRPKWNIKNVDDLRDVGSEYQIIEAIRSVSLCSKTEEKALLGLLNKRNECAHPSNFYPELNDTLGYITELLKRLETLQKRKL
jgi:hypothetical protein